MTHSNVKRSMAICKKRKHCSSLYTLWLYYLCFRILGSRWDKRSDWSPF